MTNANDELELESGNPEETSPTRPDKVSLAERRLLVFKYRKKGYSYRDIARALAGKFNISSRYSPSNAYNDVKVVLDEIKKKYREEAEEMRELEIQRLDELFFKYFDSAKKGDTFALNACLSIMDRRAKLYGLNDMKKEDFTTIMNIDVKELTTEQLKRIRNGENPFVVITNANTTN